MNLAVIVPARNATHTLPQCLSAVHRGGGDDLELLVVDDGSTDDTAETARTHGATVIRNTEAAGPAVARNMAAHQTDAEVLLFVDADVVIADDVISRVVQAFEVDPALGGVFGSYDASPGAGTFVSDYKNLLHHFTHQHSREESRSFWAGCGAVRRVAFLEVGGFDERYRRPCIEDIEFGWRFTEAGFRIRLDKRLQATHLKRWTLFDMIRVDIRDRAYPWSQLILERREMPTELNLQVSHRVSAVLVWTAVLALIAVPLTPLSWTGGLIGVTLVALGVVAWLNRDFYLWLARRRGVLFLAGAFWLHLLYYAYSSATFGWAWLRSVRVRSAVAR